MKPQRNRLASQASLPGRLVRGASPPAAQLNRFLVAVLICLHATLGWGQISASPGSGAAPSTAPERPASGQSPTTLTLTQAYAAALEYDAVYRAAGHETESIRQGVPLAKAALLPVLNLSASDSKVQGSRTFPNSLNQEVRLRTDYETPQAALQLRVPVFNWDALSSYKISKVQLEVAELSYSAQGLELLDRVAEAYVRALVAEEARVAADVQLRTFELQRGQTEQRLRRGEGTAVQVAQVQAALDLARARRVEADALVELAARQLQRLTGLRDVSLQRLTTGQGEARAPAERLGDWIDLAARQSAPLQARVRAVEAARLFVRRQYAGHLPRLDVVASLSRSENDSISNLGQTSRQRSVGVQLTVPLYSGGGVEASIRQATARQARADEEVREERELLELDVQRFYQAVSSGAKTVAAYQQAVASAELAWQGARRALEMGLGTMGDSADTQAAYFGALRDLAQARSDHLLARVRLMVRAGMPAAEITADVDSLLVPRRVAALGP